MIADRVLVHEAVRHEAGAVADAVVTRVVDAFARELERTGGSTLKRLRGPYGGTAYRVRAGKLRLPVSRVEVEGGPVVAVHQACDRARVYDTPQFRLRLERFHRDVWDQSGRAWAADPCHSGYRWWTRPDNAHDLRTQSGDVEVTFEPWLTEAQHLAVTTFLPFPSTWEARHALVMCLHGAPGSGKTLTAVELAVAAAEACDYAVLLVTTTERLKAAAEEQLGQAGIPAAPFTELERGRAAVALAPEFLAHWAGATLQGHARERAVHEWWRTTLAVPAMQRWVRSAPEVNSPRFAQVLDALFLTGRSHDPRTRDALDISDGALYDRVHQLETVDALARTCSRSLEDARKARGLMLRGQMAVRAGEALVSSHAGADVPLLVILDEVQDLVPAEWQAMVGWVVHGHREGGAVRAVLCGDENQRVSPTAFSWGGVRTHGEQVLRLPREAICDLPLPGSWRLGRPIAEFALRCFDPVVADLARGRHPDVIEPGTLPETGEVRVAVLDEPKVRLLDSLTMAGELADDPDAYLVLVGDVDLHGRSFNIDTDDVPVRLAKGLEFRSTVVVEPFAPADGRLSYLEATEAFTALTRAREHLLVICSNRGWARMAPACPAGLTVRHLPVGDAVRELALLLVEASGQDSLEDRLALAEARLQDLVAECVLGVPSAQSQEKLGSELSKFAARLVRFGNPAAVRRAADALAGSGWLLPRLREVARSAMGRTDEVEAVAAMLLTGDGPAIRELVGLVSGSARSLLGRGVPDRQAELGHPGSGWLGSIRAEAGAGWEVPTADVATVAWLGRVVESLPHVWDFPAPLVAPGDAIVSGLAQEESVSSVQRASDHLEALLEQVGRPEDPAPAWTPAPEWGTWRLLENHVRVLEHRMAGLNYETSSGDT